MDGEWKDGKYGLQLQVDHWQEIVPPTLEGVRNYLASGLLKGIGEKTADAIIEKFGVNALEILEHQPDRLLEIRGITKERLAEIKDAYAETSRMRVLMTLLAPFKVTPTTAQKIYQHFGPACADIVRQSPFNLCQVPGFGFKRILWTAPISTRCFPVKMAAGVLPLPCSHCRKAYRFWSVRLTSWLWSGFRWM